MIILVYMALVTLEGKQGSTVDCPILVNKILIDFMQLVYILNINCSKNSAIIIYNYSVHCSLMELRILKCVSHFDHWFSNTKAFCAAYGIWALRNFILYVHLT